MSDEQSEGEIIYESRFVVYEPRGNYGENPRADEILGVFETMAMAKAFGSAYAHEKPRVLNQRRAEAFARGDACGPEVKADSADCFTCIEEICVAVDVRRPSR